MKWKIKLFFAFSLQYVLTENTFSHISRFFEDIIKVENDSSEETGLH